MDSQRTNTGVNNKRSRVFRQPFAFSGKIVLRGERIGPNRDFLFDLKNGK